VWRRRLSAKPRRSVFANRNGNGLKKRPNVRPTRRKKESGRSRKQSSAVWRRRPNAKQRRNVFVSKNGSAVSKRADEKLSNGVCKRKPCGNRKMSVFGNRNENEPKKPNAKPTMRIEGASKKRRFVLIKKRNGAVLRPTRSAKRRRNVSRSKNDSGPR